MTVRLSVIELSRGSIWNPSPAAAPYLTADYDDPWPAGAASWTVFTDTSGGEITTITAEEVTTDVIRYLAAPDAVDAVPAGANFETFVQYPAGPRKIRYGKVIRREVEFPDAPATQRASIALNFTDTFPTLGLRSNWKAVVGRSRVYDNSAEDLPFGVSADAGLFMSQSAIRWDTELNSDSVKSRVVLLNQGQGAFTQIVCADQRFTSGLGVRFNSANNTVQMGVVTGPTTIAQKVSAVAHTVVDLADYSTVYDGLTRTLHVVKGTDPTPLLSWPDELDEVPHGPGYRYTGFSFDTGLLFQPGIEVAGWQAKDN